MLGFFLFEGENVFCEIITFISFHIGEIISMIFFHLFIGYVKNLQIYFTSLYFENLEFYQALITLSIIRSIRSLKFARKLQQRLCLYIVFMLMSY